MPQSPAGATNFVLQESIGALVDEKYTTAKKLSGTGIVSGNPDIDVNTETFIGQLRWYQPLNPTINVASLTDSTAGTKTDTAQTYLNYVKTVRTHGAERVNLQEIVTQKNKLDKIASDFTETRAQDEHNAILAVLKGVAISELLYGAGSASGSNGLGGQTFDNDPTDLKYGFYVDLGSSKTIIDASTTAQGAQRAENFLKAFGMGFKDYEPDYAYLVVGPETMASLRSANLVDQTTVVEGNVTFNTIFGGKFRLIQTRATQMITSAQRTKINTGSGVDLVGTKCSFIVLPGALAFEPLMIPKDVGVKEDPGAYMGGGTEEIWYRWGYILHPAGYNWAGSQVKFPSDAEYGYGVTSGTTFADVSTIADGMANTTGSWTRKVKSALSLGILPVFHS